MYRAGRGTRPLHNPLALFTLGALAVVRGIAFVATGTEVMPLDGYSNAPSLPGVGVALVGTAWIAVGVFVWIAMRVRRVFTVAMALMTGMCATWVVLHAVDLFTAPDWDSIVGLAVFIVLVPVTITLASIEVAPSVEHVRDEAMM